MKKLLTFCCSMSVAASAFSGAMGAAATNTPSTYIGVTGGYYSNTYQANYSAYDAGTILTQQSFNNTYGNGFGQIAIGTAANIGTFQFDHQVVASFLGGKLSFNTPAFDMYTFKQRADFGYDVMPKFNFNPIQNMNLFGILGVHYGNFVYTKEGMGPTAPAYNVSRNQLGFNLGAGISYAINEHVIAAVKYQHWQYGSTNVYSSGSVGTLSNLESIQPSFNLVGMELKYLVS